MMPGTVRRWWLVGSVLQVAAGCASLSGLTGGEDGGLRVDGSHVADAARSDGGRHDAAAADATRHDAPRGDAPRGDAGSDVSTTCTMCGGGCVDTNTSVTNCGACGVSCMACTAGYCLAYMDTGNTYPAQPDAATPNQLMASITYLSPLIYWAGYATSTVNPQDNVVVGNSPSATTMPDSYEEQVFLTLKAGPIALANNGQSVFVGANGFVGSFTPPTTITVSPDSGHAELDAGMVYLDAGPVQTANLVAADSTNVYWTDSTANAVMQMTKGGGSVITLEPEQFSPTGLGIDATHVYWIASRTLWSTSIGGNDSGVPQTLASATSASTDPSLPTPILAHDGDLYWGDPGAGTIFSMLSGGGTPEPVATDQPNVGALATDGTSLYWTTSTTTGASVVQQTLGGTTPVTIASLGEPGAVLNAGLALKVEGGSTTVFTVVQLPRTPPLSVLLKITPPPG
jgi:hypothetical protein